MRLRAVTAVLPSALAAAALLAAGCGSDDGPERLPQRDLAKRADAICVTYNAKLKALGEPKDAAAFGAYLDKLVPLSVAQRKELGALQGDDAVQARWERDLKAYDTQLAALRKARAALKTGDSAGFSRIVAGLQPLTQAANRQLDALGAPHCGSQSTG